MIEPWMWFALGFGVSWAIATVMNWGLIRLTQKLDNDFREYKKLYDEVQGNYIQLKKRVEDLLRKAEEGRG